MPKTLTPVVEGFPEKLLDPEGPKTYTLIANEQPLEQGEATYRWSHTDPQASPGFLTVSETIIVARLRTGEFVIVDSKRSRR